MRSVERAHMTANLRASLFGILTAQAQCHACRCSMPVSALLVPVYEEFDGEEWQSQEDSALLKYVEHINSEAQHAWTEHAPWVRRMPSKTADTTYWANACACGALQGDWYLGKPGEPFFPQDAAGMAAIHVEWIDTPILAQADASVSTWMDELIDRSPYPGWAPAPDYFPR